MRFIVGDIVEHVTLGYEYKVLDPDVRRDGDYRYWVKVINSRYPGSFAPTYVVEHNLKLVEKAATAKKEPEVIDYDFQVGDIVEHTKLGHHYTVIEYPFVRYVDNTTLVRVNSYGHENIISYILPKNLKLIQRKQEEKVVAAIPEKKEVPQPTKFKVGDIVEYFHLYHKAFVKYEVVDPSFYKTEMGYLVSLRGQDGVISNVYENNLQLVEEKKEEVPVPKRNTATFFIHGVSDFTFKDGTLRVNFLPNNS
jgi:hypothetical protein